MNKESLHFPGQFLMAGRFLSDFITSFPSPANLKDIATGRYLLGNQATLELCGLKTMEQFIGLTINELDCLIESRWGNTYAHIIDDLDTQVRLRQQVVVEKNQILLTHSGFVRIQNIIKIPVFNENNKTTAIFTYSYDLTKTLDLSSIFAFYKQAYSDPRIAIQYFLHYLGIDSYFLETLTETELAVLIAMKYNSAHKSVARKLGIQPKTVEIHTGHLRSKLKDGCLYKLLSLLRHDLTPSIE